MTTHHRRRPALRAVMTVMAALAAMAIAACGSSDDNNSTSSTKSSTGGAAAASSGTKAAAAAVAPYLSKPSAFPVTEPLKERPTGKTIAFMDCGAPTCGLFWNLLQPAAKTMGVKLTRVKTGFAADTVASAFDSVVAQKPAGVIVSGVDPRLWSGPLKKLQAAKVPVVTTGITGTESYGIKYPQAADALLQIEGKLLADYVTSQFGDDSKVAYYNLPELTFSKLIGDSFQAELKKVCPGCSVRVVQIPVASVGNKAPSLVVADLEAHRDTTVAVFGSDDTQTGVPAALKTAGIKVKTLGAQPTPVNLQYMKNGQETAALGADLAVLSWSLLDVLARQIAGQPVTGDQAKGLLPYQFLTAKDITFDTSKGWTGYPDLAERFAKLWGVGS